MSEPLKNVMTRLPTTLPFSSPSETDFPRTACAFDHVTGLGMNRQPIDDHRSLSFGHAKGPRRVEERRSFDYGLYARSLLHWSIAHLFGVLRKHGRRSVSVGSLTFALDVHRHLALC